MFDSRFRLFNRRSFAQMFLYYEIKAHSKGGILSSKPFPLIGEILL